jgi:hypothetical protein
MAAVELRHDRDGVGRASSIPAISSVIIGTPDSLQPSALCPMGQAQTPNVVSS